MMTVRHLMAVPAEGKMKPNIILDWCSLRVLSLEFTGLAYTLILCWCKISLGVYFPTGNREQAHIVSAKSNVSEEDRCPSASPSVVPSVRTAGWTTRVSQPVPSNHHLGKPAGRAEAGRWHIGGGKAVCKFWEKQSDCNLSVTSADRDTIMPAPASVRC